MSRERVFGALLVASAVLGPLLGYALAGTQREDPRFNWPNQAPGTTLLQTTNDLAPIFRCTGAGSQVVVSLGGDGKSIFVWCSDVKS